MNYDARYDRYENLRSKQLKARLERPAPQARDNLTVPGYLVTWLLLQKETK